MVDEFVAIPVGQGDAFFLSRGDFTALVDGGRSELWFPTLFQETLGRNSVDVMICTHNDADHANGILGFVESGLKCTEVWLPALWADRLDDLLTRPSVFLEELFEDVLTCVEEDPGDELNGERIRLDHLGDCYAADEGETANDEDIGGSPQHLKPNLLSIGDDDDGNAGPRWLGDLSYRGWPDVPLLLARWPHLFGSGKQLFLQALSAANRIRDITMACAHRGIPIRWFRHSSTDAKGGKKDVLEPLNAVEIARTMPRRVRALRYIALSTANRLSLTFCSPRQVGHPGVVFTADSDLRSSVPIPWQRNMIVTSPHHGSEANAAAYIRFNKEVHGKFNVIWVRSDGRFKTRPGKSFLRQPTRYCTVCRNVSRSKKALRFVVKGGRWKIGANFRCGCK